MVLRVLESAIQAVKVGKTVEEIFSALEVVAANETEQAQERRPGRLRGGRFQLDLRAIARQDSSSISAKATDDGLVRLCPEDLIEEGAFVITAGFAQDVS